MYDPNLEEIQKPTSNFKYLNFLFKSTYKIHINTVIGFTICQKPKCACVNSDVSQLHDKFKKVFKILKKKKVFSWLQRQIISDASDH